MGTHVRGHGGAGGWIVTAQLEAGLFWLTVGDAGPGPAPTEEPACQGWCVCALTSRVLAVDGPVVAAEPVFWDVPGQARPQAGPSLLLKGLGEVAPPAGATTHPGRPNPGSPGSWGSRTPQRTAVTCKRLVVVAASRGQVLVRSPDAGHVTTWLAGGVLPVVTQAVRRRKTSRQHGRIVRRTVSCMSARPSAWRCFSAGRAPLWPRR